MPSKTVAWVYTDNLGVNWLIKAKREIVEQTTGGAVPEPKVGGRAATAADRLRSIPNELKPRGVYVADAAGVTRKVTCHTPGAPLMVGNPDVLDVGGNATEITLRDALGATATYFRQEPVEENRGRLGRHTTA